MKTIAFKGNDTVLTGKEIIKTLKELGGRDYYNYENKIPITSDYITTDVLYFYINAKDIIVCDTGIPYGYTLLNINNFNIMDCVSTDKIKDTINTLNKMIKYADILKYDLKKTLEHIGLLKSLGYNDDDTINKITKEHIQSIQDIEKLIDRNKQRINYLKSKQN